MKPLLLAASLMLLAGCDNLQQQGKQPAQSAPPPTRFMMYPSGKDLFLLNTENGKVWKWDATKSAFLEVPVTSEIIEYEKGPDGELRRKPKNPNDPLGILDKPR